MADPITILGAAAAGFQLGEAGCKALIGGISLLRKLRKAPKRVRGLLGETEASIARLSYVRTTVLLPGSAVAVRLTPDQLSRLNVVVLEGEQAMQALEHEIKDLVPLTGSKAASLQRTWKSVVSLTKEDAITELLANINRANVEILREIAVLGLESDASLRNEMKQISSNVQSNHQAIHQNINTVQRTLDGLQNAATSTAQIVAQNQGNITGTASILAHLQAGQDSQGLSLTSIQNSTQSIQQQMVTIVHTSNSYHSCMKATVQSTIREELPALRDAVLSIMTGRTDGLSRDERIAASHLSPHQRAELESQIEQQLIIRPSALRDASEFVSLPKRRGKLCNCPVSNLSSSYVCGPFGIKAEYSSQHRPSCPYFRSGRQSWRYAASAQLLPLVQKTVELGLSLTSGAGFFSISPLLNAYCTVERSKSPIFRLFDEFPHRYAKKSGLYSTRFRWDRSYRDRSREILPLDWDIPMVKDGLTTLTKNVEAAISRKEGLGSDKDEGGNTILHESLVLVAMLYHLSEEVKPLLQRLIKLSIASGTDLSALAHPSSRPFSPWTTTVLEHGTAVGFFLFMIGMLHSNLEKFLELYHLIETNSLDEQIGDIREWNTTYSNINLTNCQFLLGRLKIVRQIPEQAESLGFGEIAPYILSRSKDLLIKYLQTHEKPRSTNISGCDPMCLALGWLQGLELLYDAGYDPRKALKLAILDEDWVSIDFLLPRTTFFDLPELYGRTVVRNWIFSFLDANNCHENIILKAVREFKLRLEHRKGNTDELRISGSQVHESHRGFPEQRLDCLNISTLASGYYRCYSLLVPGTVTAWRSSIVNTKLLDALFTEGFHEVDILDKNSKSPLCHIATQFDAFWGRNLAVEWFLEKGASASFKAPDTWPNIWFYVLKEYSDTFERRSLLDINFPLYLHAADPLCADQCDCFCSTSGCLPRHCFWENRTFDSLGKRISPVLELKTSILGEIFGLMNLTLEQKELVLAEICRLEVFERLGLTHTCCLHGDNVERKYQPPMSEEDRIQCQKEDTELSLHLELIMTAFFQARQNHAVSIEQLWGLWLDDLEYILPQLSWDEHACRAGTIKFYDPNEAEVIAHRADRERATLVKNGYGDFEDFADVIRVHFKRYLEPESQLAESSEDEWTDTDFSDAE